MIQTILLASGGGVVLLVGAYVYGRIKGKRAAEDKHLLEGVEDVLETQARNNERDTDSDNVVVDWMLKHGSRNEVLRSGEADTSDKG